MKLIKFRIHNYKSVLDSSICYLDDKITVIAGKNEAGKSAILEALEDFNYDKKINERAVPIKNNKLKPLIEMWFELNEEDFKSIEADFEIKISRKTQELFIEKEFPETYNFYSSFSEQFRNIDVFEETQQDQEENDDIQPDKVESEEGDEDNEEFDENDQQIQDFILRELLPNFILFRSFEDIIPNKISIAAASENSIMQDISVLSHLDFELLKKDGYEREKEKLRNEINLKFSEEYSGWFYIGMRFYIFFASPVNCQWHIETR